MERAAYINALGAFLPNAPIPSGEMEDYLGKIGGTPSRNRAFVLRQNKIKTRHYALDKSGTPLFTSSNMAARAVHQAIDKSELSLRDISYLASSSTLGDLLVPGLASHIHAELDIPPIEIANFQSVCASSIMALKSAYLQIITGEHDCAAVTGCEFASRYFRPGFYEGTNFLKPDGALPMEADFLRFTLSDGAGAALLENRPNRNGLSLQIKWIDIKSYADRFDTCMSAGGVHNPDTQSWTAWSHFDSPAHAFQAGALMLVQNFELMKKMIPVWISHYLDLIARNRFSVSEIDHLCSHYSSHSLREEAITLLKKAGAMIDEEKWFSNLATKGNTGTASIFIILEELFYSGKVKRGDKILCHVPESGRALNGFMLLEAV